LTYPPVAAFIGAERYANGKGLAKYLISRQGGIDVNIQVVQA